MRRAQRRQRRSVVPAAAHNGKQGAARRVMHPDAIDRVVHKYVPALDLGEGYSTYWKLYDRRGYNPEGSYRDPG